MDLAGSLTSAGRPTEIINADAMQLYSGMDIGTAKVPVAERRGIPHHLLDVLDVTQDASVAVYQREARRIISELMDTGNTVILVGGSGLYVSSVIFDFVFPGTDPVVRAELVAECEQRGPEALHRRLAERDPRVAERIGPTNSRRIIRALEVDRITGSPSASILPEEPELWRPVSLIGVSHERETLMATLNDRVERMWEAGMIDETRVLRERGLTRERTAGGAIGYSQALDHLEGLLSREQAIEQTQRATRKLAKRQVSWFRRYRGVSWVQGDVRQRFESAARVVEGAFPSA